VTLHPIRALGVTEYANFFARELAASVLSRIHRPSGQQVVPLGFFYVFSRRPALEHLFCGGTAGAFFCCSPAVQRTQGCGVSAAKRFRAFRFRHMPEKLTFFK